MKSRHSVLFLNAAASIGILLASAPLRGSLAQVVAPLQQAPAVEVPIAPSPDVTGVPGTYGFKIVPMTVQERAVLVERVLSDPQRVKPTEVPPLATQKIDPAAAQRK